jgi:hypothetical protein
MKDLSAYNSYNLCVLRIIQICVPLLLAPVNRYRTEMFHPQSFHTAAELADRVLKDFFAKPGSDLVHRLIIFAFDLFHGGNPEFLPCDTAFHDFDHTMQATATVVELLAAHRTNPVIASLDERDWEIAMASAILHDTGYLKHRNDPVGSGAKYSAIHVGRSCFFAWDLLAPFGFNRDELRQIQNAICATAISVSMDELPFREPREWLIGALVATGDMLGQMAADDYPERLAGLYLEFREGTQFSRLKGNGFAGYENLLDLLKGTEKFFNGYVMHMLNDEWRSVYRVLDDWRGKNDYIERIRTNISRVNLMARSLAGAQPAFGMRVH